MLQSKIATIARSLNIDYLYTTGCQMYKGQKTTAKAQVAQF